MIVDNLENLEKYSAVNPLFKNVLDFIKGTDLNTHELGKTKIDGDNLYVNFAQTSPKDKENAKLETHNRYLDIQIPLTSTEIKGYTPRTDLPEEEYNAEKDITFYKGAAESYIAVKPGMFAIFFPEDGHAPGITPVGVKKVIFKVLV